MDKHLDIDDEIKKLEIEKSLQLESMLKSKDPGAILKATKILDAQNSHKSFMLFPDNEMYTGTGWRAVPAAVPDQVLRGMAKTPVTYSVISTRVDQVANFVNWTEDKQEVGWTIRKKPGRFKKGVDDDKLTPKDKKIIDQLAAFIERGGFNNFTQTQEGFEKFLRKITKDTLELDKLTYEVVYGNQGIPESFLAVDAATILLADNKDWSERPVKGKSLFQSGPFATDREYTPAFVQVWRNQIYNSYYPWEMSFGMRNDTTDIMRNGYGQSELEVLMQVITWILYGQQYNGYFFQQGSNPKGFFNIKGNLDPGKLNEFKQAWRSTVTGINNVHKIPVLDGEDLDISWNDMQGGTNKDMEWSAWEDFLLSIHCAVYSIDPSEIGYNLQKSSQIFGQDGQKERLKHSKTKGLHPILRFVAKNITHYLIEPFTDEYEFIFTGYDIEDQTEIVDLDSKKMTSGMLSLEDAFRKHNGREFDPEKDTILNPVYLQIKQMDMMGGDESNMAVDEMEGEEGSYEDDLNFMEDDGDPFDLTKALRNLKLLK